MNKVVAFIKAPLKLKYCLTQTLVLSAYYRYLILHRDFSGISDKLGIYQVENVNEPNNDQMKDLAMINRAINMVCSHTPWKSECLVRAFIASYYLKKKKIPGTVYMGVCRDENGSMIAHAWTKCGKYSVTGGSGEKFTVTGVWGIGMQ